jgi:hypothetical protein
VPVKKQLKSSKSNTSSFLLKLKYKYRKINSHAFKEVDLRKLLISIKSSDLFLAAKYNLYVYSSRVSSMSKSKTTYIAKIPSPIRAFFLFCFINLMNIVSKGGREIKLKELFT